MESRRERFANCCSLSSKATCLFIAAIELIFGTVRLYLAAQFLTETADSSGLKATLEFIIIIEAIQIIANVCLLVGVFRRKAKLLAVWLYITGPMIFLNILGLIMTPSSVSTISYEILRVYFMLLVHSYKLELEDYADVSSS